MGKYANLILTDCEYKVMNALKIIDFAMSTIRQVLPGLRYQIPAKPEKLDPLVISHETFFERLSAYSEERTGEKFITSTYSGIATQIAHEIVYRACGNIDTPVMNIDKEKFYQAFSAWQELLVSENYTFTLLIDPLGKPTEYSYMDISYMGNVYEKKTFSSSAELFDLYFAERDRLERVNQRAKDLITLLNNAIARTERKLSLQREALIDSQRGEEYKKYGDLITANIYKLSRGMESFSSTDYYSEDCPEITVPLDVRLSPSQNAQKMYKLYNKSKTAKEVLSAQIKKWEGELSYLQSVRAYLDDAETEQDILEIREELYRSGYSSKIKDYRPQKKIKLRPISYTTSGGFTVLVGRNNIQNDELTLRYADKSDIWLHVKDIHGSHVILVCEGREPSDADYTEAAEIAAYHSKAGDATVGVDYTRVKNIKKPQGSAPGFVSYKTNYTAYVRPMSRARIEELRNG
jgi:predicted ribosome quality control (RQC) complex YloA/Tae2 family protein